MFDEEGKGNREKGKGNAAAANCRNHLGSPSTHRRPRKRAAGSAGCILWMLTRAGRACPLGNSATAVQGSWLRRRSRLRGRSPKHAIQQDIPERERPLRRFAPAPLDSSRATAQRASATSRGASFGCQPRAAGGPLARTPVHGRGAEAAAFIS